MFWFFFFRGWIGVSISQTLKKLIFWSISRFSGFPRVKPQLTGIPHNMIFGKIVQTGCTSSSQIETRQSKSSSGCFFAFFRKQAAFFSFKVVEKRSTRHLKAEILYFSKIKILGHVEYSTPPDCGLNSTCGPKKAHFHGAKNAKYGSWAKKSIFSKSGDIDTPIQPRKRKPQNNVSSALKPF